MAGLRSIGAMCRITRASSVSAISIAGPISSAVETSA
jgi:hypothetical protein